MKPAVAFILIMLFGFLAGIDTNARQNPQTSPQDTVVSFQDLLKFYNARIVQVDIEAEKEKAELRGEFNAIVARRVAGDSSKVVVQKSLIFRR